MAVLAVAAVGAVAGSALATAAGAAAGATFLGMSAAGWGWTIGSVVGQMLFADGGKPSQIDKKVQSSIYGEPIPIVYATERVAAWVAWASELHVREEGGKGGPDGYQVASVDLLLSVCEGPKTVLAIYGNGRLIWENDGTPDGRMDEELIRPGNVRIYSGTEDQQPDPLNQAAVGIENAPAYRGEVMIMLEGLECQFAGNRPPSITVVVADAQTDAEAVLTRTVVHTFDEHQYLSGSNMFGVPFGGQIGFWLVGEGVNIPPGGPIQYAMFFYNPETEQAYINSGGSGGMIGRPAWTAATFTDPDTNVQWTSALVGATRSAMFVSEFPLPWVGGTFALREAFDPDLIGGSLKRYEAGHLPTAMDGNAGTWLTYTANNNWFHRHAAGENFDAVSHIWSARVGGGFIARDVKLIGASGSVVLFNDDEGKASVSVVGGSALSGYLINSAGASTPAIGQMGKVKGGGVAYVTRGDPAQGEDYYRQMRLYYVQGVLGPTVGNMAIQSHLATLPISTEPRPVYDQSTGHIWIASAKKIYRIKFDDWIVGAEWAYDPPEVDEWDVEAINGGDKLIEGTSLVPDGKGCVYCVERDSAGGGWIVKYCKGVDGEIEISPITLGEIVQDVSVRCDIPAEMLDVEELTDLVDGYKIARQTTGRQAIEALRPGYFFDMIESGLSLVGRKLGADPVLTIDSGDLGARVWSAESTPAVPVEIEHMTEIEAPMEVVVSHVDADANFDPGVQRAFRQATGSTSTAQLEVPVVMSAEKAARVAWTNLLHAHASRDKVKFALSHAYSALEPGDAVVLPLSDTRSARVRIESISRARPLLELEGVFEDASIYRILYDGLNRYQGPRQTEPLTLAETVLHLLDIPPLRDEDDALLWYAAGGADTYGERWSSATVYKSMDDGASYASVARLENAGAIGVTTTVLGNWAGGNVFDRVNSVEVTLTSGAFESATRLAVLNGANAVVIGDEIIQFETAALAAANTYRLSGLLRGRKGTERGMGTHQVGERVVGLTYAALRIVSAPVGDLNVARWYKGVTGGRSIADTPAQSETLAGNSLRPLSPVHISAERVDGDVVIEWIRRARIAAEWIDGIDVPLDETTEAYEVDILDGTSVVRTLTASTPTATYTQAQQILDFGSPQSEVSIAVYQLSSRVGRGHPGEATV